MGCKDLAATAAASELFQSLGGVGVAMHHVSGTSSSSINSSRNYHLD